MAVMVPTSGMVTCQSENTSSMKASNSSSARSTSSTSSTGDRVVLGDGLEQWASEEKRLREDLVLGVVGGTPPRPR